MMAQTVFMKYMESKLAHEFNSQFEELGFKVAILHGDPSQAFELIKACRTKTRLNIDFTTDQVSTEVYVMGSEKDYLKTYNWFMDNLTTCVQVDYNFETSSIIQYLFIDGRSYLFNRYEISRENPAWFSATGFVTHSYWDSLSRLFNELELLGVIKYKVTKCYCPFENLELSDIFNPLR
jgi:hypothetical protein